MVFRIYRHPGVWLTSLLGLEFPSSSGKKDAGLEEGFSMEDFFCFVAPSLFNFSAAFWQFSLDFVKGEVMRNRILHEPGRFVKSLTLEFFALF